MDFVNSYNLHTVGQIVCIFLQRGEPMYQPQNQKPVKVSNGLGTDAKIDAALHHKP